MTNMHEGSPAASVPGSLVDCCASGDTRAASTAPARLSVGHVAASLERMPPNAMHVRARLMIGLATFLDGFDVIVIATALPFLIAKWGLSPVQIGWLIAAGSLGQLLGTFLFPYFADRFGRVRSIAWSCGLIGATSVACGFAPTFTAFLALRLVQGIGLGGEVPVAATYINEISRASNRGRFVLLYEVVFPIGLLAANALGAYLVPRHGWEIMYFIGGAPILLLVLPRLVPESPRWLAQKGRSAAAERALRAFEAKAREPLPPVPAAAAGDVGGACPPRRQLRDLLGRAYLARTLTVWSIWIACGFIQYGLTTWLPTIYRNVYHAPLQLALNLAVIASLLAVAGSLVCALIVDRVGRKPVIGTSLVLCAASLVLAGLLHQQSLYVVAMLCSLAFGFIGCGFITAYVYTPELYPTSVRAMGCGLGGTWLKVAAIAAPALVARTLDNGSLDQAFYLLALVPFVAAIVVKTLGIETKGRTLEQLAV